MCLANAGLKQFGAIKADTRENFSDATLFS